MSQNSVKVVEDNWTFDDAGERLLWHLNRVIDRV
jgi:hypothetical protein